MMDLDWMRKGLPVGRVGWTWLTWGSLLSGCAGGPDPTDSSGLAPRPDAYLVDMAAWVTGDAAVAADPFPDHQPEGEPLECPTGSVLLEGASLEIRTGTCKYAWLQQPLLADLREGEPVEIVYWHSALVADPPAQAHFALTIGDRLLFERTVEIPSAPAAYTESFASPIAGKPGDIVTLHLHNHGTNDWNFLRVERVSSE